MKIILAPDKFKGTLTAPQVTEIEERAIRTVLPEAEIVRIPLADGGDGTVQALTTALGGTFETVSVRDPPDGLSMPFSAWRENAPSSKWPRLPVWSFFPKRNAIP